MEIGWLEQLIADLPLKDGWLSSGEQRILAGMKVPKRRSDWRLGRWTAKQAVAAYFKLPSDAASLAAIEIRSAPTGAPEVFLDDQSGKVAISLSHRDGRAACTVVPSGGVVGCDLEVVEPRSETFILDYFTTDEREFIAQSVPERRDHLVTVLWSAKESALKALCTGLRVDTRTVSASMIAGSYGDGTDLPPSAAAKEWHPLSVRHAENEVFTGWWQCIGKLARTVVSVPPSNPPTPLSKPSRL
jgi:4'-phosphopantetheinyl transferase